MKLQTQSAEKHWRALGLALLATGLTTAAFAQETAAVLAPDLKGYSVEARAALIPPVRHSAVCNGPEVPGTARCHAHIVMLNATTPLAMVNPAATPAGFGPT